MLHHTAYGAFFRSCIIELGFPIEMGVPPESERLCISRVSLMIPKDVLIMI